MLNPDIYARNFAYRRVVKFENMWAKGLLTKLEKLQRFKKIFIINIAKSKTLGLHLPLVKYSGKLQPVV